MNIEQESQIFLAAVVGLLIGSFINVAGLRIPIGQSVLKPSRSYCPSCKHELNAMDLIPVFSYLIRLGKCKYCKHRISAVYPFIELLTACLYTLAVWQHGFTIAAVIDCFAFSIMVTVCVSDLFYQIIPDQVTLPALLILLVVLGVEHGDWIWLILNLTLGACLIILIVLISRGGMGGGDIRLNAFISLFLGWKLMLVSFVLACLIGSIVGGMMILGSKATRKSAVPFGPYLTAAAILTFLFGNPLLNWYQQFVFGV